MATEPVKFVVKEDTDAVFLARLRNVAGALVTQATLSSIAVRVYDVSSSTPTTAVYSASAVVADTVFDALQGADGADARWPVDNTGYNFRHTLDKAAFPTGDHLYWILYWFTPVSGNAFPVKFVGPAEKVLGP